MDKQLEQALLSNLILKTKIVIAFFLLYLCINLFTIYEIISREIEVSSTTLLYFFPGIILFMLALEYGILKYLQSAEKGSRKYNRNLLIAVTGIEVSYPSLAIIYSAILFLFPGSSLEATDLLNVAQFMVYVLFILLSSLHFDFKLSVFVGILAAIEFMLIIFYYADLEQDFEVVYSTILKTIYFIPFGIIAGLVSVKIKQATLQSLAAKNILINELDQKVAERTKELQEQKEIVEEKNIEIMDSINYASRIQNALLPQSVLLNRYLKNFIIYRPKDVVAGDFYWFHQDGDNSYFAVADCTGHGVPGAMVSVVCSGALDKAVKELGLKEPAEILKKSRDLVIQTLDEGDYEVNDGMDISFCKLNLKERKVSFSGAHNSLYRITGLNEKLETKGKVMKSDNKMLIDYKGDNMSVGKSPLMQDFTQEEIELEKGDVLYLSSDGYPDQFGGERNKKFMHKPMKQMLLDIHENDLEEQKKVINQRFNEWKGGAEQVDDVCVMGVLIG